MRIAGGGRARVPFRNRSLVAQSFSAPNAVAKFWPERQFQEALRSSGTMRESAFEAGPGGILPNVIHGRFHDGKPKRKMRGARDKRTRE